MTGLSSARVTVTVEFKIDTEIREPNDLVLFDASRFPGADSADVTLTNPLGGEEGRFVYSDAQVEKSVQALDKGRAIDLQRVTYLAVRAFTPKWSGLALLRYNLTPSEPRDRR